MYAATVVRMVTVENMDRMLRKSAAEYVELPEDHKDSVLMVLRSGSAEYPASQRGRVDIPFLSRAPDIFPRSFELEEPDAERFQECAKRSPRTFK